MSFFAPEVVDFPERREEIDAALDRVPDRPAVFLIRARTGPPYLARTTLLRRRLRRLLRERAAPGRFLNLRDVAARLEYWLTGSLLESTLLFYRLAVGHFPDAYTKLIKLRMPPYLKVLLANPFPRTQVTTRLGGANSLYFGPFRTRSGAEEFEKEALNLFQVRRCQEDLAPSPQHPGCIYGEMNMCLRPCQEAVGAEEYRSEVDRFVTFLSTEGRSLLEPLESARDRLSDEMDFEEAARLHKQIEKVQQSLRLRDDLVREIGQLYGVAVTPAAVPGAVNLWFVAGGCWQPPVHFGFEVIDGKTVSIDRRLRDIVTGIVPEKRSVHERQEHLALLARWYYSSWRDGDWVPFPSPGQAPYRKLVRAIHRLAAPTPARDA